MELNDDKEDDEALQYEDCLLSLGAIYSLRHGDAVDVCDEYGLFS